MAQVLLRRANEIKNRDEHQQRTEHREKHELEGGVKLAAVTPDADEEIHWHQHHFPKGIEQEQVDREQGTQKPSLEQQYEETELARARLDISAARVQQRQRDEQRSQYHEEKTDAVHPNVVRDSELRNPRILLDELVAGFARIKRAEQI